MNLSKPDPNDGQLVPLAHQEVRYRAAPTWTRALQWAIVGCIGFGFIYGLGICTVNFHMKRGFSYLPKSNNFKIKKGSHKYTQD